MIKSFGEPVPIQKNVKHGCGYRQDVEEFLASGEQTAEVCTEGSDAVALVSGYRAVISRKDEFRGEVRVQRRGDRVFLVRLDKC